MSVFICAVYVCDVCICVVCVCVCDACICVFETRKGTVIGEKERLLGDASG